MEDYAIQPVAALVDTNKYNTSKEFTVEKSTYREKEHEIPMEGDYKAGDMPRLGDVKGEIMGLGVFDGDKFVGELDGDEASHFLMVTGEYRESLLLVPDPLIQKHFVLINVKQSRAPKKKVNIKGENPKIHVKIQLEGDFVSIQSGHNYEKDKEMPIIEKAAEALIKEDTERLLNKTASEYEADIFGFGKEVKKQFLTIPEWEDFDWLSKYKDSTFTVEVDVKIRRPGLIIRTSPVVRKK